MPLPVDIDVVACITANATRLFQMLSPHVRRIVAVMASRGMLLKSSPRRSRPAVRRSSLSVQPDDLKLLRLMFSRHNSYGHLVGSLNCGIIAGIANLTSHEGMEVVCEGLDLIWPDPLCRPNLMFYDNGCKLRTFRMNHPNASWLMTRYIVDRYALLWHGATFYQRWHEAH